MVADVIYLTEKLITVQKMGFSCLQWFLWAFKVPRGVSDTYPSIRGPAVAMPPAWLFSSQLSSLCSCPSLGFFHKTILLQGAGAFSCCSDFCRTVPWPELLPERVGFSKLSLMGSLQAGKTTSTRLCPVVFIAQILFISFDIQSSRFHSKDISSKKMHRTTYYKSCVCVSSAFADAGSLCYPTASADKEFLFFHCLRFICAGSRAIPAGWPMQYTATALKEK